MKNIILINLAVIFTVLCGCSGVKGGDDETLSDVSAADSAESNSRNRYTEEGLTKRNLYPSFLHSNIRRD